MSDKKKDPLCSNLDPAFLGNTCDTGGNNLTRVTGIKLMPAVVAKMKSMSQAEATNFMENNYFSHSLNEVTGLVTLIDVTTEQDPNGVKFSFSKFYKP